MRPAIDKRLMEAVRGRTVLYIATKNLDYLRIQQEIEIIKAYAARVEVLGSAHKGYIRRLAHILPRLIWIRKAPYDVVFVGFMPQMILPFFAPLFRHKTIIMDFFISLYDTLVYDRCRFKPGSLVARFLRYIDRAALRRADLIIADTHAHGEYFINELDAPKDKLSVLYLQADASIYYPQIVQKPENLSRKFVVLYFGSILPLQGVDIVVKAAEILKDNTDIHFRLIGPLKGTLKVEAEDCGIECIHWLGQRELANSIAMADLCLAGHFHGRIEKAKRTIAGKTYIYRAMNKPVILGDNPANRELYLENDRDIFYIPMGSAKALADKILEVFETFSGNR